MRLDNSRIQNQHLAKSNIDKFLEVSTTDKFNAGRYHQKAVKAFRHMPDYGKGVCNGKG